MEPKKVVKLTPAIRRTFEETGSIALDIGSWALIESGSVKEAMKRFKPHCNEIALASILEKVESRASHSEVKSHILWLAKQIDVLQKPSGR